MADVVAMIGEGVRGERGEGGEGGERGRRWRREGGGGGGRGGGTHEVSRFGKTRTQRLRVWEQPNVHPDLAPAQKAEPMSLQIFHFLREALLGIAITRR